MPKKQSFETQISRLEEIVRLLEQGDASLEDSMKWFEEGAKLSAKLSKQLDEAEQKVTAVYEAEGGQIIEEPFEGGAENEL